MVIVWTPILTWIKGEIRGRLSCPGRQDLEGAGWRREAVVGLVWEVLEMPSSGVLRRRRRMSHADRIVRGVGEGSEVGHSSRSVSVRGVRTEGRKGQRFLRMMEERSRRRAEAGWLEVEWKRRRRWRGWGMVVVETGSVEHFRVV